MRELRKDIVALGAATNKAAQALGQLAGVPPIQFD
jgi:hypothetical protein